MSQIDSSVTINTVDITEEQDDDDSDLDDVIKSTDKTEFRLGIVGVVFIIAGALFLIVPGTVDRKQHTESSQSKNSSGFFITGGVMFGLGAMMIAINVFWCLNEQRILRDLEKAKEKKAQERNPRSPQCAYHSLPQPDHSSSPASRGSDRYVQDSNLEMHNSSNELENYRSYQKEPSTPSSVLQEDANKYAPASLPECGSPSPPSPDARTYDNPSYLSDTRM